MCFVLVDCIMFSVWPDMLVDYVLWSLGRDSRSLTVTCWQPLLPLSLNVMCSLAKPLGRFIFCVLCLARLVHQLHVLWHDLLGQSYVLCSLFGMICCQILCSGFSAWCALLVDFLFYVLCLVCPVGRPFVLCSLLGMSCWQIFCSMFSMPGMTR